MSVGVTPSSSTSLNLINTCPNYLFLTFCRIGTMKLGIFDETAIGGVGT